MGLPRPLAAAATVAIHPDEPTLIVKPAPGNGYASVLWRQGHQALMDAQLARHLPQYMNGVAPDVWTEGVRGVPAADGSLRFNFRRGDPVYRELVGKPGLSAIVTVDRNTSHILRVAFRR